MREKLSDLVRRVLSGSVLLSAGNSAMLAVPPAEPEILAPPSETGAVDAGDEVVVRASRPRLVLKRAAENSVELISSHRSHRSHSSHRSHYSSSGAPATPTTPARPRPETTRVQTKAPAPLGPALGSRILVKGMKGSDVMELMRLLVAHSYLTRSEMSADSLFTDKVESAVKMFQIARGVAADGKVGPTVAILLKRPP